MLKSLQCLKFIALALLGLSAPFAYADHLFTNWSSGVIGGNLWTSGGPCPNCFALEDNFSNPVAWDVTEIDFYVQSYSNVVGSTSGWRNSLSPRPVRWPLDLGAKIGEPLRSHVWEIVRCRDGRSSRKSSCRRAITCAFLRKIRGRMRFGRGGWYRLRALARLADPEGHWAGGVRPPGWGSLD